MDTGFLAFREPADTLEESGRRRRIAFLPESEGLDVAGQENELRRIELIRKRNRRRHLGPGPVPVPPGEMEDRTVAPGTDDPGPVPQLLLQREALSIVVQGRLVTPPLPLQQPQVVGGNRHAFAVVYPPPDGESLPVGSEGEAPPFGILVHHPDVVE